MSNRIGARIMPKIDMVQDNEFQMATMMFCPQQCAHVMQSGGPLTINQFWCAQCVTTAHITQINERNKKPNIHTGGSSDQ